MSTLLAMPDPHALRRELKRALLSAALALTVQTALVALVVLAIPVRPPKSARASSQVVSLRTISSTRWANNRGAAAAARPEKPAPLHPQGQVVDVASGNQIVPKESKYLAETDNQVQHETRAREQTKVWSRATAKNQPNPTALPSAHGRPSPQVESASSPNFLTSAWGRRQWSLFGDHTTPGVPDAEPSETQTPVGTEAGTQATGSDTSEGGGAPNDALTEVKEGDGTFLNTREWKYAAFFNRVKQAVAAKWDPNGRLSARRSSPGFIDRMTTLHVALRPDGSLADVYVARGSGLDDLDQEAVKAFEKAQPFSNPPQALIEQGFIRFTFGFTVTNGNLSSGVPRFVPLGR